MFKNFIILVLASVLSFSAGLAGSKYCPFLKRVLAQDSVCTCVK